MPSTRAITARYLTRFRCRGGDCEDTCCQGWQIPLDRRQFEVLEAAMSGTPAERAELEAGVERERAGDDRHHARLRMLATGACSFLLPERLCSIQRRYGERALPAVCSTFPRLVARAGERAEVWGALSCPELARQCLLHDDAVEVVEAPADVTPRWEPARVLPTAPELPYDRYLDEVRAAGQSLLSLAVPVRTRLFLLAYLGKETAAFFRKDAEAIDGARLAAVIAHVQAPETVTRWQGELDNLPPPRALTANLVSQLLAARTDVQVASFRRLVDQVLDSQERSGPLSPAALWSAHAHRREEWQALVPGRIDRYFENYARAFWLREWHTTAIDLQAHVRRLLVRVAALRLLLFGHPAFEAVRALSGEARREALDRTAVEVFYTFSRAVEHQGSFLERIAATVVEEGLQTFAHSAFLTLV